MRIIKLFMIFLYVIIHIMLIFRLIFLILDCTRVALSESQFKIILIFLILGLVVAPHPLWNKLLFYSSPFKATLFLLAVSHKQKVWGTSGWSFCDKDQNWRSAILGYRPSMTSHITEVKKNHINLSVCLTVSICKHDDLIIVNLKVYKWKQRKAQQMPSFYKLRC